MTTQETQSTAGTLAAVVSTLSALIAHLPPDLARRAAVDLEADRCVQLEQDEHQATPLGESEARDATMTAFVELLQSVAARG